MVANSPQNVFDEFNQQILQGKISAAGDTTNKGRRPVSGVPTTQGRMAVSRP